MLWRALRPKWFLFPVVGSSTGKHADDGLAGVKLESALDCSSVTHVRADMLCLILKSDSVLAPK